MRILPRGPSSSIRQSGAPISWGITSKNAVGTVGCGPGLAAPAIRLSLPYSRRKTLAVWKTPCWRAAAAADAHNPSGIGNLPRCDLRQRSNRRQIRCMPAGTSNCALVAMSVLHALLGIRPTLPTTARQSHAGFPKAHEAFDLAAAFGLIGRGVHDENADGSGDA